MRERERAGDAVGLETRRRELPTRTLRIRPWHGIYQPGYLQYTYIYIYIYICVEVYTWSCNRLGPGYNNPPSLGSCWLLETQRIVSTQPSRSEPRRRRSHPRPQASHGFERATDSSEPRKGVRATNLTWASLRSIFTVAKRHA